MKKENTIDNSVESSIVFRLEQFAVGTQSRQGQNQYIAIIAIDKKPIRGDVALTVPHPVACQTMVFVLFGQGFSICQLGDDGFQYIHGFTLLHGQLVVFFKLGSVLYCVLAHASKSAKSASKSV